MNYVTVRHLPEEKFKELNRSVDVYNDTNLIEFAKSVLSENNYIRVADFKDLDHETPINVAVQLTNTVSVPWYETQDDNIIVEETAKKGCRSTSVGDLIQINGDSYVVCPFGFLCVNTFGGDY